MPAARSEDHEGNLDVLLPHVQITELAALLGVPYRTVSSWHAGKRRPTSPGAASLRLLCQQRGWPVPEIAK